MIWAILAILGVPVWLVVGALLGGLASRRRFRAQEEVFPLWFRKHDEADWPRSVAYGRYVHNVLLVNRGLALVRTSIHVVERADSTEFDAPPKKLLDPVAWTLTLDNGEQVDIAVAASDAQRVSAPTPSS